MSGLLTVPNITLGSNGKINSYDDYHYIQISQPTDTLTIQEFGKIIFSIGQTKTEIGRINSSGMTITGAISATSLSGSGSELTNLNYNNISTNKPDLTLYAIKTNVDASLNSLSTNKQNNLTFSDPFLNTSNTISLKLNSSQFNIDSSGNLNLIANASSQWITSGSNIYYNSGNVGINNSSPYLRLDVGSTNANGS